MSFKKAKQLKKKIKNIFCHWRHSTGCVDVCGPINTTIRTDIWLDKVTGIPFQVLYIMNFKVAISHVLLQLLNFTCLIVSRTNLRNNLTELSFNCNFCPFYETILHPGTLRNVESPIHPKIIFNA